MKDCDLSNLCYVGYIQNNIDKRLFDHFYIGAPKDYMMEHYNIKISKKELEQNVKCIEIINHFKKITNIGSAGNIKNKAIN